MRESIAVVVTSIAAPNAVLQTLARECQQRGHRFYVIGDVPSPPDFALEGCEFYSLERQRQTELRFAEACPTRHYARKNIGYLLAIRSGAGLILETDDDNFPLEGFWAGRTRSATVPHVRGAGWVNVYRYFTEANIWPRGLPLDAVQNTVPELAGTPAETVDAPIQQGLADDNPDVDAIYRLVLPLPVRFRQDVRVALGGGSWCPFNSQNTTWWPDAYPLLYLPSYCSFRMTDIWRSFVAQRIAWANGWSVLFESPSVTQERNDHNLLRDFEDEIPGYLCNRRIGERLQALGLRAGGEALPDNLRLCYEALVAEQVIDGRELALLEAWLADLRTAAVSK